MPDVQKGTRSSKIVDFKGVFAQSRIIGALMMREIMTRYGREGLGFFWLVAEPLIFCLGVLIMWHFLKPPYEHGILLGPFVMTGYMCLLLIRHMIGQSVGAVPANTGLLYHRAIKLPHIFATRIILEFLGATIAFFIIYILLLALGQVELPSSWLLLYGGWFLMGGMAAGVGLIAGGLAMLSDQFERLVGFISYALIPISGAFMMTSFLPPSAQEIYRWVPFPHATEMVRASVFGEFVETHYDPIYGLLWVGIFNFVGLLIINAAKDRIEIE